MHYLMQNIERYLMSCRELTAICSQNGWIDSQSLSYEIIQQDDHEVIAFVQFEEIISRGSDCEECRVPCQGRLRLLLDRYGQVYQAQLV